MKTLRLSVLILVAATTASVSLAASRAHQSGPQAPAPKSATTVSAPAGTCERMTVKQGKRTQSVECTSAKADTAKCKAHCGS